MSRTIVVHGTQVHRELRHLRRSGARIVRTSPIGLEHYQLTYAKG